MLGDSLIAAWSACALARRKSCTVCALRITSSSSADAPASPRIRSSTSPLGSALTRRAHTAPASRHASNEAAAPFIDMWGGSVPHTGNLQPSVKFYQHSRGRIRVSCIAPLEARVRSQLAVTHENPVTGLRGALRRQTRSGLPGLGTLRLARIAGFRPGSGRRCRAIRWCGRRGRSWRSACRTRIPGPPGAEAQRPEPGSSQLRAARDSPSRNSPLSHRRHPSMSPAPSWSLTETDRNSTQAPPERGPLNRAKRRAWHTRPAGSPDRRAHTIPGSCPNLSSPPHPRFAAC